MEKRLRRARTTAIVLAVVSYLVSKVGCVWLGTGTTPEWRISAAMMPTTVHIFMTLKEVFEHTRVDDGVRLTLMLCGLGFALVFALVAYIVHAMLRVDAD